jgi:hexosaminidase
MRDVIQYAARRHIDIVPELDMPGHMMAAIAQFPYLSGAGGTHGDKVTRAPMCPCNESTFTFAENVYKEIFSLFPSPYVHIGGDEVERSAWAAMPACKELMRRNDMKTLEEIQSYFIRRMDKFFRQHGKRLIGWDEILEGGMDSTAVIMYWRSWAPKAPLIAARHGNEVIMTPGNPLYFDQWPDKTTLFSVYHFEPVPAELSGREREKILGAQANVWTERIPSEKRADYMTMPRMTALAEAVWTHRPEDYLSYRRRLLSHYERWDRMRIHYRLPDLEGFTENNVFVDSAVLDVGKPLPEMVIHYTTDGSQPGMESPIFPGSVVIKSSMVIRLAAFSPGGNQGDVYTLHYEKESYRPPVDAGAAKPGLECIYVEGAFDNTAKMDAQPPQHTYITDEIKVPAGAAGRPFGLRYRGFISVPATGVYSFFLMSDDGSKLRIDGKTVVDNDGLHSPRESSGQIALQKGMHSLDLDFFEAGGGYTLRLQYSGPGGRPSDIPKDSFHH